MLTALFFLVVAFPGLTVSSTTGFGPAINRWLNPVDNDRKSTLLRIRGGADKTDTSKDAKVKGCCIGIDLGTTYRYSNSSKYFTKITSSTKLDYIITSHQYQLCCSLEKWQG